MGMYVHSGGSAEQIPGGVPSGMLERIENDIAELRDLRAGFEHYGMAMTTESGSVTDRNSGLVLWAGEKNAALPGTIMNEVAKNKEEINLRPKTIISKKPIPYTQTEVSFSVDNQGIYIASVSSVFVSGTVYILICANSSTAQAVPLAENGNYFKMISSGGTDFKVKPGGVSGELTVIKIS